MASGQRSVGQSEGAAVVETMPIEMLTEIAPRKNGRGRC